MRRANVAGRLTDCNNNNLLTPVLFCFVFRQLSFIASSSAASSTKRTGSTESASSANLKSRLQSIGKMDLEAMRKRKRELQSEMNRVRGEREEAMRQFQVRFACVWECDSV